MVKKQLIMEKALELFAEQGFEATSVQQITEHCGISKGAFYLSFKSKDELILSLIDHFMEQFTSDLDYAVRNAKNDKLLYTFFYTTYQSFHKHSNFAKLLMKEQTLAFNEELLQKMKHYDELSNNTILTVLDRLYGPAIKHSKYDLMYCIKGFMQMYSGLVLFHNVPLDLELLSRSLVEKTEIVAKHTTLPFVTEDLLGLCTEPESTKEHLLDVLEQKINELEDSIERESLVLLKEQLHKPTFGPAIVKGLLENIRNHPHCKWVSYLLQNYFETYKPSES